MARNYNREESLRLAAETMRLKKEKEAREDKEYFEKITSGWRWLLFKVVVVFCTLMALLTTVDTLVDGETKQLSESQWKVDREWEWTWHQCLDVQGYSFFPHLRDWSGHVENTMEITYSPIFRTGKTLSYDLEVSENYTRRHEELRRRSIFTWFPFLQIFMLIPLVTFLFKSEKSMFNFARVASLALIFPGTLLIILLTLF